MPNKYILIYIMLCMSFPVILPAQEALKSAEEEYYDFLALQGLTKRPTLNYRTLSDSVWSLDEGASHPWQGQNLGTFHHLFGDFRLRAYGPELFMSVNTAAPYGQNDGVLWQGRGFNALFKSGIRFEGYGVELTLLPHFAFSQNAPFDIMSSHYESEYGYFWGYGKSKSNSGGADAPQRFGDKPFFDWDFGDSEIRYTWKTLTIGFGTQAIWLGPSYLNSILHSNNAPAYPKFDIGLRRQRVTLPWLGWYLGDVEARLWVGRLSESDYFDNDDSNNSTMFHGFSFAYAPSFLPGLTLFVNRVCLVPWEWEDLKYMFPSDDNTIEDQKASFGFSWIFPQVGFEVYGEMGIDDFVPDGSLGYIRHLFHTTVYTAGLKKTVQIKPKKTLYSEIIFEFNWMEMTKDYFFYFPYSFYFHYNITQGYTNRGQWLGNGLGSGGNSQYLAYVLYYHHGSSSIFIQRNNPDNNYIYKNAINDTPDNIMLGTKNIHYIKANFDIGITTLYFVANNINISGGIIYNLIINPFYKRTGGQDGITSNLDRGDIVLMHNFSFNLGMKVRI